MIYLKNEPVPLKNNSEYSESWVQDRIAENPSILGLGKLALEKKEHNQGVGRLDLLLYDKKSRYIVELQLGKVGGSHITRTIEYWDIEQKLRPEYKHYAVLVAEDVTHRFLNVIELYINKGIPLIVLQMQALKVGEYITLAFMRVLGKTLTPSVTDKDEKTPPTTHASWGDKIGSERISIVDKMLEIAHNFDSTLEPTYNKNYITFKTNGRRFMTFWPYRNSIRLNIRMRKSEEIDEAINSSDLDFIEYTGKNYSFFLNIDVMNKERKILEELAKLAFDERNHRR